MKIAIYPGSFNPWHGGHDDVLAKALKVFDRVVIAQGVNAEKKLSERTRLPMHIKVEYGERVVFAAFRQLLTQFVSELDEPPHAVIRGLRNGQDLEFEKAQQRWNEDLGIKIPTFYVISDREWEHVSSSAIRMVEAFKK